MRRVEEHPILGELDKEDSIVIYVDGTPIRALPGEPIASALYASGIRALRFTPKLGEARGIYCAIGQCTDCVMVVNGVSNVRTCVTPVAERMEIETQHEVEEV